VHLLGTNRECIERFIDQVKPRRDAKQLKVPCPICKEPITKRGLKPDDALGEVAFRVRNLCAAFEDIVGACEWGRPRWLAVNAIELAETDVHPSFYSFFR
jgi:hypothetical protein